MMTPWRRIAAMLVLAGLLGCTEVPPQQHPPRGPETTGKARGPIRITDEELHRHGGTPPGWKFTVPDGDPKAGRAVFIKLECCSCHQVDGEKFPARGTERQTGPLGRSPKDTGRRINPAPLDQFPDPCYTQMLLI